MNLVGFPYEQINRHFHTACTIRASVTAKEIAWLWIERLSTGIALDHYWSFSIYIVNFGKVKSILAPYGLYFLYKFFLSLSSWHSLFFFF